MRVHCIQDFTSTSNPVLLPRDAFTGRVCDNGEIELRGPFGDPDHVVEYDDYNDPHLYDQQLLEYIGFSPDYIKALKRLDQGFMDMGADHFMLENEYAWIRLSKQQGDYMQTLNSMPFTIDFRNVLVRLYFDAGATIPMASLILQVMQLRQIKFLDFDRLVCNVKRSRDEENQQDTTKSDEDANAISSMDSEQSVDTQEEIPTLSIFKGGTGAFLVGSLYTETSSAGKTTLHSNINTWGTVVPHDLCRPNGHVTPYSYNRAHAEEWAMKVWKCEGAYRLICGVTELKLPRAIDDQIHRIGVCEEWQRYVYACRSGDREHIHDSTLDGQPMLHAPCAKGSDHVYSRSISDSWDTIKPLMLKENGFTVPRTHIYIAAEAVPKLEKEIEASEAVFHWMCGPQ